MNNLQWIYFPYEKDIWWNCWNGESRKDRSGDVRVGVSHCIQKYIEVMLDDGRLPSNHTHLFHSPYNLISSIVFTSLKHSPCYTYHTLCLWLHGAWPPLSTLVDPLLSPDIIFGQRCKPLICASSSRHSMNSNLFQSLALFNYNTIFTICPEIYPSIIKQFEEIIYNLLSWCMCIENFLWNRQFFYTNML